MLSCEGYTADLTVLVVITIMFKKNNFYLHCSSWILFELIFEIVKLSYAHEINEQIYLNGDNI